MGFNSVYRVLQDIFQQVDSRILRAVAIEHPKDADVAVEVVLAEVIPRLSEQSRTNKGKSSLSLSEDGARTGQFEATMDSGDVLPCLSEQYTEAGPSNIGGSLPVAIEDADLSGQPNSPKVVEPVTSEPLCTSCFYDANGEIDTVCYGIPIPLENLVNNNINHECVTPASISENGVYDNHDYGCVKTGDQNAAKVSNSIASSVGVSGSIQEEAAINDKFTHENGVYDDHDHGFVKTGDQNAAKMSNSLASGAGVSGSIQEEAAINDKITLLDVDTEMIAPSSSQLLGTCEKDLTVTQELNSSSSSKTTSEKNSLAITIVDPEDELIMTSVLTRSDQTCSTELLQDIIEDARNDKKTLALAMDSVVNLMKEVEFKERAAEQAKERAACGCSDILAKELQLRLLNLSDERSRSLEILEEIRLTTALKEIEAAEEEKLEKERSAKEALAYQESQMEMVVEESKKLKMEAEENSKLQEFLMDRGRAIDILQTTGTPSEPELETYGTPKTNAELGDSYGFLDKSSTSRSGLARSPKSPTETVHTINDCFPSGEEKHHDDDRKMLLDDGWELFDNGEDLRSTTVTVTVTVSPTPPPPPP
ncbi:hypothetical protein Ccrd_017743 [Cynara cardunculus var. scolymus]|uniref:Uncharacterized protein n=1 Tax=Cynara cardunculus var. scolymus TaxID=59895 RepID=A0A103Y7H5_CYNCS|nr:hypothetical protein Ccrd_017743 [Cynara cardunculus var. scolymus]